jgi:hypothetical protein
MGCSYSLDLASFDPHYLIEQNTLIVQNPSHLNYLEWLGAYHFPMALETGVIGDW